MPDYKWPDLPDMTPRPLPSQECKGKVINKIELDLDEHELRLTFDHGVLVLADEGQQCCEARYMSCDDPFTNWEGLVFMGYDIRDGRSTSADFHQHDQKFLHVHTFLGSFTVVTHNEHNGYYGGFHINERFIPVVEEARAPKPMLRSHHANKFMCTAAEIKIPRRRR